MLLVKGEIEQVSCSICENYRENSNFCPAANESIKDPSVIPPFCVSHGLFQRKAQVELAKVEKKPDNIMGEFRRSPTSSPLPPPEISGNTLGRHAGKYQEFTCDKLDPEYCTVYCTRYWSCKLVIAAARKPRTD